LLWDRESSSYLVPYVNWPNSAGGTYEGIHVNGCISARVEPTCYLSRLGRLPVDGRLIEISSIHAPIRLTSSVMIDEICWMSRGIRFNISAVVPFCLNSPLIYLPSVNMSIAILCRGTTQMPRTLSQSLRLCGSVIFSRGINGLTHALEVKTGNTSRQNLPCWGKRIESFSRTPRESLFLDRILHVPCSHVNREGCVGCMVNQLSINALCVSATYCIPRHASPPAPQKYPVHSFRSQHLAQLEDPMHQTQHICAGKCQTHFRDVPILPWVPRICHS
jgi:hypothetical protein